MEIPFFDLKRQNEALKGEYADWLDRFLRGGQTILGEEVALFEKEFATNIGVKHCITCGNATDALEILLDVLEIGDGDEVMVPAFGWVSVVSSILKLGATPVFVDVGEDGNIEVSSVENLINEKTRALVPVHLYGNPCDIESLRTICKANSIFLIEDCAQAHGATLNGKYLGSIGDASVFSFYPTKNLGAMGDGGAILTSNDQLADLLRMSRNYGRNEKKEFVLPGRNSRLDEWQAGILRIKLRYLESWNKRRKEIAANYNSALGKAIQSDESVYYKYVVSVKERSKVIGLLDKKGIETAIYYPFQLDQLAYLGNKKRPLPVSEKLSHQVLSTPLFPEMTKEEITYICEQLQLIEPYIV